MTGISAILITRDEERNVADCLASLTFADQIIVVDSGSVDRTEEICRRDPRVRWYSEEWKGYGLQKNSALDKAEGRWIFSIDADERVTPELAKEVGALDFEGASVDAFRVCRRNFFGGKWVRHGGWYPDYVVRMWRRGKGSFDGRPVHESVTVAGPVGTLRGELLHFTYRDTADFLERMVRYSTLGAQEMARSGRRATTANLILRPSVTFFKMFFLKRGFLDGALGFRLAVLYSKYTFAKYAKLAEILERQGDAPE